MECGLLPESVKPSVHDKTHPTSLGYAPPDTVIDEVMAAGGDEGGGGGSGAGGVGGAEGMENVTSMGPEPDAIVIDWPKPVHIAPFQPSPNESV